jgi:hypothetical protein
MRKIFCLIFVSAVFSTPLFAEGMDEIRVDISANGKYLVDLLRELENEHQVDFLYFPDQLKPYRIFGVQSSYRILDFLAVFLENYYINQHNERIISIISKETFGRFASDQNNYIILESRNESRGSIRGRLIDIYSKEPLLGADIIISALNTGTRSEIEGKYEISLPKGIYQVEVRHVGYETVSFLAGFSPYAEKQAVDLSMFTSSTELEAITIIGESEGSNIQSRLTGIERMDIQTIKSLPAFMGEVDPIRSITTLPGVSTAGELASGFNVRGGEAGQNLILQDGAVIYNPTHLFGIFSAFNPDLVQDVNLYKGGGPAGFGGRISSTLDIDLKNGNLNSHAFSGGVGLVSTRLTVEGPILKSKLSYVIGGRISYSDWLVRQVKDMQLKNSEADFHDVTARLFYHPDKKNMISVTGYYSYDDFKLGNDSIFSWNTRNLSLEWDHIFNEFLSGLLTISGSKYESRVNFEEEFRSFDFRNSISNIRLKYHMQYSPADRFSLNYGIEGLGSYIEPGEIDPASQPTNVFPVDVGDQRAVETAAFFQGSYDLFENLGLSFGLRYSHFFRMGPGDIYMYDYENLDGRYPSIYDTVSYSSGDLISDFGGFEPRISLRYSFNENVSIKASYYRTIQYTHLISNTITPSPLDFWIASGPWVKPVTSDQYSFGLFRNLRNNRYEISAEAYYRKMINVVDYIEGADLVLNEALEGGLTQGPGKAYGVEVQVKRNEEKLNGWISYTWSRSLRKFDNEVPILTVNSGEYYSSPYDQPHDFTFVANYRIWERSVISVNFNYKTGRPITIPVSKFGFGPVLSVLNYSDRNEYRMPDYHRLDLTITLEDKIRRNKRYRGEWILSIYNVYGRKNAYSIYFDEYGMAHKVSILGSIFPSLSYNFKF